MNSWPCLRQGGALPLTISLALFVLFTLRSGVTKLLQWLSTYSIAHADLGCVILPPHPPRKLGLALVHVSHVISSIRAQGPVAVIGLSWPSILNAWLFPSLYTTGIPGKQE